MLFFFYQSVAHGINVLSRSSKFESLEDTIGEACSVCAEAISKCIHDSARGDAYLHILETVYLAVVFVLRSIHELADRGRTTANRQLYMVVQTIASWIDAIVYRCLHGSRIFCERFDINKMEARMAFVSLGLLYASVTVIQLMFNLPESIDSATTNGCYCPNRSYLVVRESKSRAYLSGGIVTQQDGTMLIP